MLKKYIILISFLKKNLKIKIKKIQIILARPPVDDSTTSCQAAVNLRIDDDLNRVKILKKSLFIFSAISGFSASFQLLISTLFLHCRFNWAC